MTAVPLVLRLLQDGISPTLLLDLLDPEGMKAGLAGELTADDVKRAPAPPRARHVRTA